MNGTDFSDINVTFSVDSARHSNKCDVYFTDKPGVPVVDASKNANFTIIRTHRVGERTIPYIGAGHFALVSKGFEAYQCHIEFPTTSSGPTVITNLLDYGTFGVTVTSPTTFTVNNNLTNTYNEVDVITTSNTAPGPVTTKVAKGTTSNFTYGVGSHYLIMINGLALGPANGTIVDCLPMELHVSNGTPLGPISFTVAGAPNLASS